jgi:hypothetical protein
MPNERKLAGKVWLRIRIFTSFHVRSRLCEDCVIDTPHAGGENESDNGRLALEAMTSVSPNWYPDKDILEA